MADAVETTILKLLIARLNALVFVPVLPIDWQNATFAPPATNYLKAVILWNRNINRGIADNSSTEYRGIFQVSLVAAINTGLVGPTNITGAIAAFFERGAPIQGDGMIVKIEGKPSLAPVVGGPPDRTEFPVSIRYYACN